MTRHHPQARFVAYNKPMMPQLSSAMADSSPLPPHQHIRWRPWLILWAALGVIQLGLLWNNAALDTFAWRSTRWLTGDKNTYHWIAYKSQHAGEVGTPFYQRVDPPWVRMKNGVAEGFYKRTENIWRLMRDLGEPYLSVLLIAAVSLYDRRGWKAGALFLMATGLAVGLGTLIRATGGRFRPEYIDGANDWSLWRGFHDGTDLAWPSGTATLAFATAAVLTYLSPRGRWLFLTIAAGCAVARVVMDAHFWSDAIFGGVLGWTVGWFTTVLLDRLLASQDRLARMP